MSSTEPRSGLIYGWSQAENFNTGLDGDIVQLGRYGAHMSVKSRTTATPPGSPAAGDGYIIPSGATGVWSGLTDYIAIFDGAWIYKLPVKGWQAYVEDQADVTTYTGSLWTRRFSETGTWTPVLSGSTTAGTPTYTTQTGFWQAEGRMIEANFRVTLSAVGGIAGDIQISGFPACTTDNTANKVFTAGVSTALNLTGVTSPIWWTIIPTVTQAKFTIRNPSATNLTEAVLTATSQLRCTLIYLRD